MRARCHASCIGPRADSPYCATIYAGGALGPVILAQFIPGGDDPSYAAALIADSVVILVDPLVFIVGWTMVRRALARQEGGAAGGTG